MYAGVYGSPFPKLNPNVRYKTVFERAGFDTNSGGNGQVAGSANGNATGPMGANQTPGKVHAQGYASTESFPKPSSSSPGSSRNNEVLSHGSANVQGKNTSPYSELQQGASPYSEMQQNDMQMQQDNMQMQQNNMQMQQNDMQMHMPQYPGQVREPLAAVPQPATSSHASSNFNFESNSARKDSNVEEMNPIDRSFFMLTQNDSHSTMSHSQSQSPQKNQPHSEAGHYSRTSASASAASHASGASRSQHSHTSASAASQQRSNGSSHSSTSSHFKRVLPAASVSYDNNSLTQQEPLHKELSVPDEVPFPVPSPVHDLDLGDDLDLELKMPETVSPTKTDSLNFEPSQLLSRNVMDTNDEDEDEHEPGLLSNPDPYGSDTLMTKNSQVEQLIAELDGVSFSRNEQISQTLNNDNDTRSSASSANGLEKTLLGGNTSVDAFNDPRFKKSSAYLSGFPVAASSRSSNDSNTGVNPDGTPTFYKFRTGQQPFSPIDGETQIGTMQLDGSMEELQVVDPTPEPEEAPEPVPEVKYPPGEGPCRLCGKDVLEKGVYSKRDNELSGQWHRNCFKCVKCSTKFNKRVPCYILNDLPYCQQHYHEENHSICQVCSKFIEGECLENDNNERFHIDCLRCFICKKIIENDYFIFNDEVPICADHDLEMLVENGLTDVPASTNTNDNDFDLARNNTVSKRRTRVISFMG